MKASLQEKTYKALGSARRLEIVRLLKINKSLTVGQIAEAMISSMQVTSQQLQVLERAHVVEASKEGLQVFYTLRKPMSPIVKSAIALL